MTTRREQAHAILAAMLQADPALYERILDTPGFAFHFNALAKLARDEDPARQLLRNVIGSWRLAWDCSANPGHTEVEVAVLAAEQALGIEPGPLGPAPDGKITVAGERVAPGDILRASLAAVIVPPDPENPLRPAPSSSRLPCCGRPMGWCVCGI